MEKFIDDNIRSVGQNTDPKKFYQLKMYIKKLYGMSIREYRREQGIKQKNR
jgi:predicted transcriptional regulator